MQIDGKDVFDCEVPSGGDSFCLEASKEPDLGSVGLIQPIDSNPYFKHHTARWDGLGHNYNAKNCRTMDPFFGHLLPLSKLSEEHSRTRPAVGESQFSEEDWSNSAL